MKGRATSPRASSKSRSLRAILWIGIVAMRSLPLLISYPDELHSLESIANDLGFTEEQRELAMGLYAKRIPPLVHRKCLPYLFGVSARLIAAMEREPRRYYRIYSVKKATGGTRQIEAPRRFLKLIQIWINSHVLSHTEVPTCVIGFVKGRNIFDNAKVHAPNKNLMVIDIQNFFPSITLEKVTRVFDSLGLPPEVSLQLGRLCCLGSRLPQGAPTSPTLANVVFRPVDDTLQELTTEWNCKYTRYADDLAFSGSRRFSPKDVDQLAEIIERFGLSINHKKTRIIGQGGRQIVTGLVVNKNGLPLRAKRRLWRAIFHRASRHPHEFLDQASVLVGLASFVSQFSPNIAAKYKAIAEEVQRRRG